MKMAGLKLYDSCNAEHKVFLDKIYELFNQQREELKKAISKQDAKMRDRVEDRLSEI